MDRTLKVILNNANLTTSPAVAEMVEEAACPVVAVSYFHTLLPNQEILLLDPKLQNQ